MSMDTTSTGMAPIAPAHDALETTPVQSLATMPKQAAQSLFGEGKMQVTSMLGGLAEAVRDVAAKLDDNGAGPIAKYAHNAADAVSDWADTVDSKSPDELIDDTRTLVRTSPMLAVALAIAGGFVAARLVRAR